MISDNDKKFREIYNDYYPFVLNILYKKVNSREDAEDICSELFVSFYNSIDKVKDVRKWFSSSVRYQVINFYKKKKVRGHNVDLDAVSDSIDYAFVNGARELRIILKEAITSRENFTTEKEKLVFDLIAVNKYTIKETARHLGMTRRQVQYMYRKTCQRIKDYLKKRGIERPEDLI